MPLSFRTSLISVCLAACCLSITGCATTQAETASLVTVAAKDSDLSTFTRLVQQAGLTDTLSKGAVTVFAPTDEAFKAVPAATLDKLSKDPELLKSVLTYHVLPGKVTASAIDGSKPVATLNGAKLNIAKAGDFVTVDEGMVITADIDAGEGVIHKIDRVLMPAVKK